MSDGGINLRPLTAKRTVPTPGARGERVPLSVEKFGDRFIVRGTVDIALAEAMKAWPRPRPTWNSTEAAFVVGNSFNEVLELLKFAKAFKARWADDAVEAADRVLKAAEAMRAHSEALGTDLTVEGLGGRLFPFQGVAVAFALRQAGREVPEKVVEPRTLQEGESVRVLLGDSAGLGKTPEALAILHTFQAFPAVLVVRANGLLNWQRHVEGDPEVGQIAWLPGRTTQLVRGRTIEPGHDVYIVSQDSLYRHVDALRALKPKAVGVDEVHHIRNRSTRRCKAVFALSGIDEPAPVKDELSGKPWWGPLPMNYGVPVKIGASASVYVRSVTDLIAPLTFLGLIGEFGGPMQFRYSFEEGAGDKYDRGSKGRREAALNTRLRSLCMVRRHKKDVFKDLPPVIRSVVPLELEPEALRVYQQAEEAFLEWLSGSGRDVDAAMRAERLTQMNYLRQLAGEGKVAGIQEWLGDFMESGEEKVLVFAIHKKVQDAMMAALPGAARIEGGAGAANQAAVDRFQTDPTCRALVASLKAGGEQFTITAATHVVTSELWWTAVTHFEQAEGRAFNRVNDLHGGTSWYFLAKDTIDYHLWNVIQERARSGALVQDGKDEGAAVSAVVDAVAARMLAARGARP